MSALATSSGAGTVSVTIASAGVDAARSAWHLEYDVHNAGTSAIWLVDDGSLVFRRDRARIELSYARERMQPGASAFGYFDPKVIEIAPGETVRRSVEIRWPCRLGDLWNAKREAAPSPGQYDVRIRVGFGMTPAPRPSGVGEGVEKPVLEWQNTALSEGVQIAIPPYPGPHDPDSAEAR